MSAEDLLGLARALRDDQDYSEQARWRTTANRSYLAAVVTISELLIAKRLRGAYPRNHEFYDAVEDDLLLYVDKGARGKLRTLKGLQAKADYTYSNDFSKYDTDKSVIVAEHLVRKVRESLQSS